LVGEFREDEVQSNGSSFFEGLGRADADSSFADIDDGMGEIVFFGGRGKKSEGAFGEGESRMLPPLLYGGSRRRAREILLVSALGSHFTKSIRWE